MLSKWLHEGCPRKTDSRIKIVRTIDTPLHWTSNYILYRLESKLIGWICNRIEKVVHSTCTLYNVLVQHKYMSVLGKTQHIHRHHLSTLLYQYNIDDSSFYNGTNKRNRLYHKLGIDFGLRILFSLAKNNIIK